MGKLQEIIVTIQERWAATRPNVFKNKKIKVIKIIDGQVWCNEIEKWVTPEEYSRHCEPDFEWENEILNGR